ncbi:growth-regulating factor 1-like [Cornus florida]|uniref:growth-regulating factor 1-like n=1 Tax=Cornus florida TaxID=4283 RepID=UPI002898FE0F|nr:growth-regulating factor 1-like [Cornus florida]
MMMNARNRFPFTAIQWEELEHQALIFKYMVSGVPVPPDLILTVKRSCSTHSSSSMSSSPLLSYQPNLGWGSFQMGFGRKVDAEPWRCRRTDGKKWRCSKEAYPDSKYCERHMHRGRNRSRKPVELLITSTNPNPNPNPPSPSIPIPIPIPSINNFINSSPNSSIIINPTTTTLSTLSSSTSTFNNAPLHPFLSPPSSSSSRPLNNTTHHLFLDSASYSKLDENCRYATGTLQSLPDSYAQLTKNSSIGYSQSLFQSLTDNSKHERQQQQQEEEEEEKNCFILGSDFKSTRPIIKVEREVESRKPFHHFFGEWPKNNSRDSWLEIDQKNQSNNNASFFAKNLSASMPLSTQDLFASKNRYHIDG